MMHCTAPRGKQDRLLKGSMERNRRVGTGESRTGQDRVEQGRAGQDRTGQGSQGREGGTGQGRAGLELIGQDNERLVWSGLDKQSRMNTAPDQVKTQGGEGREIQGE